MGLEVFAGQLFFAILVGALVGTEREHTRKVYKKTIPFGIRTTIFFSVLGFIFAYFSVIINSPVLLAIGAVAAITIATTVYISNFVLKKHQGATSYIAMMIVFFMGVLVGLGGYNNYLIAAALSIVVTGFLMSKHVLVNWASKLKQEEIFAAVKFGIIAVIILPLLPNRFIDPFNLINPYKIWYIIVAISAIYFISYIMLKKFSEKGLAFSALFGGLICGSATVYNLSLWIKKHKSLLQTTIGAIFIACITSILSDVFVVGFVLKAWSLLLWILPAQTAGMVTLLFFTFFYYDKKKYKKFESGIESPFAFKPALKFGAIFFGIFAISGVLYPLFGNYGLYPIALLSSLVSSSAFIASTGALVQQQSASLLDGAKLIIFSSIISLLVKIFWVYEAKNKKLIKSIAVGVVVSAVVMAATLMIQISIFT